MTPLRPGATPSTSGAPTGRRLALALAVSIALHGAIATRMRMPAPQAPRLPLEAVLVAAQEESSPPPPPAKPPPVAAPKRPAAARKAPKPARAAASAATVPATVATPALPPVEHPVLADAGAVVAADAPSAHASALAPPASAPPELAADGPAVTALRIERPLSPEGSIQFDVYYGSKRFLVGHSELSWEIADGRYRLASSGKTIGLAALFYPFGMSSTSEGRVTAAGFEPDSFRLDRTGKKGEKQYRVEFDHTARVARFTDPDGVREVPLRPSSLDILSLVCQLSVVHLAPGPLRLNLTNGRKLDTYDVEVGAQEIVETPMGDLRAVYVKQVRKPGDEGIEVWLAVDFAYLPVRLRFTDRTGSIAAEQLVTGVQLVRG